MKRWVAVCLVCIAALIAIKTRDPKRMVLPVPTIAVVATLAPTPTATATPEWEPAREDVELIARTIYGEAQGIHSEMECAAVAWCILNRVDHSGASIRSVVTAPAQFYYKPSFPLRNKDVALAIDVLKRWHREQMGEADVGRVLPREYRWFGGDGKRNYFRNAYEGGKRWDWSLENPYQEELP